MRKICLITAIICIILTSCSEQNVTPRMSPSVTPKPIRTATVTQTPTKTPLPTFTPTPTITPLPTYKTKKVIFDYNVTGDHSVYDMFFAPDFFRSYSKIVLYDDGQMIVPGKTYQQKALSPNEIKQFLSKLDAMGFYTLVSNQAHDPSDKLYNFGNKYERVYDAYMYCILVNAEKSRKLCVYEPGIPFLIPKMKHIVDYLNNYEPAGMTPYYPDRILLWVQAGRNPYDEHLPKTAVAWAKNFPSLELSPLDTYNEKFVYVDGNIAKEIYLLYDNANAGKVFIQNGKEYTVYFDVVLPHEEVTNVYQ